MEYEMNEMRQQFAKVFAQAYIGRNSVMGSPIIYYSPSGKFGWTSSLTPLSEGERRVLVIEEGMAGYADPSPDEEVLEGFALVDDVLWAAVLAALEEDEEE